MDIENSGLERRVLAHERILPVLIARMSEAEPKFLDRVRHTSIEIPYVSSSEQDYTDTLAYARQFIGQVMLMKEAPPIDP